jgi:hypothetical protein
MYIEMNPYERPYKTGKSDRIHKSLTPYGRTLANSLNKIIRAQKKLENQKMEEEAAAAAAMKKQERKKITAAKKKDKVKTKREFQLKVRRTKIENEIAKRFGFGTLENELDNIFKGLNQKSSNGEDDVDDDGEDDVDDDGEDDGEDDVDGEDEDDVDDMVGSNPAKGSFDLYATNTNGDAARMVEPAKNSTPPQPQFYHQSEDTGEFVDELQPGLPAYVRNESGEYEIAFEWDLDTNKWIPVAHVSTKEEDMEEGGKSTRRKRRRTNKKQPSKSKKGSKRKSSRRRTSKKTKR